MDEDNPVIDISINYFQGKRFQKLICYITGKGFVFGK